MSTMDPSQQGRIRANFKTFLSLALVASIALSLSFLSYSYFQANSKDIEKAIVDDLRQHSKNEAFHLGNLVQIQIQSVETSVRAAAESDATKSGDLQRGSRLISLLQ